MGAPENFRLPEEIKDEIWFAGLDAMIAKAAELNSDLDLVKLSDILSEGLRSLVQHEILDTSGKEVLEQFENSELPAMIVKRSVDFFNDLIELGATAKGDDGISLEESLFLISTANVILYGVMQDFTENIMNKVEEKLNEIINEEE